MTTVGQLVLLALPRTCTCGHPPFDHRGFARDCDECGCVYYTETREVGAGANGLLG